jgi:hypothetical protein
MKCAQRSFTTAIVGAAAVAVGVAGLIGLSGPAAAAPTGASASPSAPSAPPSTSPSGSASPVASGKPSPSGAAKAPKATVYDMSVGASDVTFQSKGPARGVQSYLTIKVRNSGSAAQQGLTVTVVEPSGTHLTGRVGGDSGIDSCVHGTILDGRGAFTCQVHDEGPGQSEGASFGITADLPLPADRPHPTGGVILHGFHEPNAHPEATSTSFAVHAQDTSLPTREVDLRIVAHPATLARGADGRYRGTVTVGYTNAGTIAVPEVTLEVVAPANVTLVGPTDDGRSCDRVNGDDGHAGPARSGMRCNLGTSRPSGSGRVTFNLVSDVATTNGTVGVASLLMSGGDAVYTDPSHRNATTFAVTFTGGTPSGDTGRAAGSGSSLPVTGTPLGLIAGGGATVLTAGGVLLVLARRSRSGQIRPTGPDA